MQRVLPWANCFLPFLQEKESYCRAMSLIPVLVSHSKMREWEMLKVALRSRRLKVNVRRPTPEIQGGRHCSFLPRTIAALFLE